MLGLPSRPQVCLKVIYLCCFFYRARSPENRGVPPSAVPRPLTDLRSVLICSRANQSLFRTALSSPGPLSLSFETTLMELVELSTSSLAEAMFEKLGLPKPVYHVRRLEERGYRAEIEFHRTKEHFHTSARRTKLRSHVCEDGQAAMNQAADLAIEYMETRENKVLVDYNYYLLEQQKKAYARLSDRMIEKSEEINQYNKTIKQITKEACVYVDEVRAASNKINDLANVALEPAASVSVSSLKQAILEIHDAMAALQNSTSTTSQLLEEKGIYSDDDVSEPVYSGHSDEDSADNCHPDMGDDYGHYIRSP